MGQRRGGGKTGSATANLLRNLKSKKGTKERWPKFQAREEGDNTVRVYHLGRAAICYEGAIKKSISSEGVTTRRLRCSSLRRSGITGNPPARLSQMQTPKKTTTAWRSVVVRGSAQRRDRQDGRNREQGFVSHDLSSKQVVRQKGT